MISFLLQSELESLKSFQNSLEQNKNSQKDFSQIGTAVHKYFRYFVNTPIRETEDEALDKSIQDEFVIIGENHPTPATSVAIPENLKYHNENESVEKKIKSSIKTQTQFHCLQLAAYAIYLALKNRTFYLMQFSNLFSKVFTVLQTIYQTLKIKLIYVKKNKYLKCYNYCYFLQILTLESI